MYSQLLVVLCAISAIAAREQCPKPKTQTKISLPQLKGAWHLHAYLNYDITQKTPECLTVYVNDPDGDKTNVTFVSSVYNTPVYLRMNVAVKQTQPPRLIVGPPEVSIQVREFFFKTRMPPFRFYTNVVMFEPEEYIVLWSCFRRQYYYAEQAAIFFRKPERNEATIQKIQKQLKELELPHESLKYPKNPETCDRIKMPAPSL